MNHKYLPLDCLPPFPHGENDDNQGYQIALYLDRLLSVYQLTEGNKILLPSLMELASFFHVSQMKVYDAFKLLHKQGYDYTLTGMSSSIPFWISEFKKGHISKS